MAFQTTGTRNPNKNLPADIRAAFSGQTYYGLGAGSGNGFERLTRNADVVQQGEGGGYGRYGYGVSGLGCDIDSGDFTGCEEFDPSQLPSTVYTPPTDTSTQPYLQNSPYPGPVLNAPTNSSGDVDWASLAKIISAGTGSLVPILAATNKGVIYKVDPKTGAVTVYSQPAGSTVNLPVGGSIGTFTTPLGTGTVAGFSSGTLVVIAALGLVAFMAMGRR